MSTSSKEIQVLERLFRGLTDESNNNSLASGLNDLFVRINIENGEVTLYGEDDELLCSTVIFSWVGKEQEFPKMLQALHEVIKKLESDSYWKHDLFERPFSISLVNEAFETIEELLFVDDELIGLTTPLLANLDEDLSAFISELLDN